MKIIIRKAEYAYEWLNGFEVNRPTVICLHGFLGTSQTFACLKNQSFANILAIDLLGHGQSSIYLPAYRYAMSELIADLSSLTQHLELENYYLLGYSMGSRVALAWSLTYPNKVLGLVMEAGIPGIKGAEDRAKRRKHDQKWVNALKSRSMAEFVTKWQAQALFNSQRNLPLDIQQANFLSKASQSAYGMQMSLMQMGSGAQQNYWPQLSQKGTFPLLYLAGKLDSKYCSIGKQVVAAWAHPKASLEVIAQAGHCVHLEQPESFKQTVMQWLKTIHENQPR